MVGENRRLVHYQPMDFSSWPVQISSIKWQSDSNFNPLAISRWTKKCPGNVVNLFCELLDFSRKKYSNTGRYPGNGNRYPPGHEHGYLSACMYWGMQVRASKMNGNLLRGDASILRSSAECFASVLRHSAPTAPRLLTFTFCLACLARRADSLHNLLLTKLHRSIIYVHYFTCSHCVESRHLLLVVLRTFCKAETS